MYTKATTCSMSGLLGFYMLSAYCVNAIVRICVTKAAPDTNSIIVLISNFPRMLLALENMCFKPVQAFVTATSLCPIDMW